MASQWRGGSLWWLWGAWVVLCGCGGEATGGVRLLLSAEASITDGLSAGTDGEDIVDGWDVRFERYVVAVGRVELARTSADRAVEEPGVWLADLVRVGEAGRELSVLPELSAGQWDLLSYATPRADDSVQVLGEVPAALTDQMIAEGWTYYIEAVLQKEEQEIFLQVGVDAAARFENCELDGQPGVSVTGGTTQTATLTFHGDHPFFNAAPATAEGAVQRRAQWVADADADGDGVVGRSELQALRAEEVFTSTRGYSLDGFGDVQIDTGLDFLRAQLRTQGHYQGEGECTWRIDTNGNG